ncbi:MAG: glycosyltransferase family 2 protein [Pseudooceanicola nanhaiensis]
MSEALPVSVVVVSRARPEHLKLCLSGLSRLLYPNYEIIVVADAAGLEAVREAGLADEIKTVACEEANISAARNVGIAAAAGEVVAFIDDDAVPEPAWLHHLARAFRWPETTAAGGYVRGPNGLAFQARSRSADGCAREVPLDIEGEKPVLLSPTEGRAIKTEGTNMAVRRSVLAGMGGFDPAYRFYLDETDLNLRLARAGHATAIVPLAEVHHASAASDRRSATRAPSDLFEVGASSVVFLKKHCPEAAQAGVLKDMRAAHRRSLLEHMVAGRCEPRDVRRQLARFDAGVAEGRARPASRMPPIPHAQRWFLPFRSRATGEARVIAGRLVFARRHRAAARAAAATGLTVSLFLFSRTVFAHRVRFTEDGYWEQRGGLWGRSERSQNRLRTTYFRRRLEEECERTSPRRCASM